MRTKPEADYDPASHRILIKIDMVILGSYGGPTIVFTLI